MVRLQLLRRLRRHIGRRAGAEMTRYEAEATNGYGGGRTTRIDWSQLLVPIVAAALVLALGLALVAFTSEPVSNLVPPTATSGTF